MENSRTNLGLILGVILIAAGVLFLVGELTGIASFNLFWPLIVAGVGVAFFVAMFASGPRMGALAIPGSILVMIGAILFIQNLFNIWQTWSFAWGLIIVAVGIGLWIDGAYTHDEAIRTNGNKVIQVGLTLFVIFGVIFSLLFNYLGVITGGISFWGIVLVAFGVYLLIIRSIHLMTGHADWDDRDLFWPVIMIGVGLVLTLYGLGALPLATITGLWVWWPLILVMIGVDWLVGRRWPVIGAIIATLLVVVTILLMFDPAILRSIIP